MSSVTFPVGSLVRARDREWVVLPSDDPEVVSLRPLTGGERESCSIFLPLNPFGKLDQVKMNPGADPEVLDRCIPYQE